MKRSVGNVGGVNYLRYDPTTATPIGVVLFLHGQGERGNDIKDGTKSVIENNELPKQLVAGMEVPYIVIAPQLPSNQGGWYENTTTPIIMLAKSLGLDIHLTGLSLGGMVLLTLVKNNPGVFKTVAPVCGKVDFTDTASLTALYAELAKIPCRAYYDPYDITVAGGYDSINRLYQALNGKTDISLILYPGMGHTIWPKAYIDYWPWLASKITQAVATSDSVVSQVVIGSNLVITTASGKKYITPLQSA